MTAKRSGGRTVVKGKPLEEEQGGGNRSAVGETIVRNSRGRRRSKGAGTRIELFAGGNGGGEGKDNEGQTTLQLIGVGTRGSAKPLRGIHRGEIIRRCEEDTIRAGRRRGNAVGL